MSDPELESVDMPSLAQETEGFLSFLLENAAVLSIMFGGAIPFIPQYFEMTRLKQAELSSFTILAILVANLLRIAFWFLVRFEYPLLVQSIVMVFVMLFILHNSVHIKRQTLIGFLTNARVWELKLNSFWNWPYFIDYVIFTLLGVVLVSIVTLIMQDNAIYVEGIGFFALFIEAMMGVPQLLKNHQNKSTMGMSIAMVVMWFSGDMFKTIYFFLRNAPQQFIVCGSLQICIDLIILFQVFLYKGQAPQQRSTIAQD